MAIVSGMLASEGSWWIKSKKDPRWDSNGQSSCVGGFSIPREAADKIEQLKKDLGNPPDDLRWGYMKD